MNNGQVFFSEVRAYFNLRKPKGNKPTNIYLVVRIGNVQKKYATGVKVYPTQWNTIKQEAILNHRLTALDLYNNVIVNNRLDELRLRFLDVKYYICNNPKLLDKAHIIMKEYLYRDEIMKKKENALIWYRKAMDAPSCNIANATKQNYIAKLKILEGYVKTLNVDYLTFDMITARFLKEFQDWLFIPYDDKGNIRSTRTIHNTIVAIKTILCWADEKIGKEVCREIKEFKPTKVRQEKTKVVLTDEEITQLYKAKLTGRQKEIRDVFILQCEMGQRFSDMCNLNNGKLSEDGNTYTIVQQKTMQQVTIPLSDVAKQILSSYNYSIPVYLLDITDKELKKIAKEAGLNREVLITKEEKGRPVTNREPLWKHVSSHLARRSFVTNWLKAGLDSHIIKGVTGHRTEEAFKRYDKVSSEDAAQVMLKAQKKNVESPLLLKEHELTIQEADVFATTISTLQKTYKQDVEKVKEQRLDDTLNIVASLMEDDVDTHSIAKAIEKADFRVSIDNGSMGSIIMRKDTKKRQVKFEKTDEVE